MDLLEYWTDDGTVTSNNPVKMTTESAKIMLDMFLKMGAPMVDFQRADWNGNEFTTVSVRGEPIKGTLLVENNRPKKLTFNVVGNANFSNLTEVVEYYYEKNPGICGMILLSITTQLQACKINAWRNCNPDPTGSTWGWIDPDNFFWSVQVTSAHVINCVDADEGQTSCSDSEPACCLETLQYTPPDITQGHTGQQCGNNENTTVVRGDPCGVYGG